MSTVTTAPPLRTPWVPSDYGIAYHIKKGGAWKLFDSGIAPLVAQARGYKSITTRDEAKAFASLQRSSEGRQRTSTAINALLRNGEADVLAIPTYTLASINEDGVDARPYNSQYRPSDPDVGENGKVRKYLWLPGSSMVLDIHPATPASYLRGRGDVLLVEGLLKADSALSAYLARSHGYAALALAPTREDALKRLNGLMEDIAGMAQLTIVATASVTTWNHPDQWRELDLPGRRVTLAFDGDLATNAMVWSQTNQARAFFYSRAKYEANFLDFSSPAVELAKMAAGMDPADKVGMDEYLTRIGDIDDALELRSISMPREPVAERYAKVGDWRVNPDCPAVVEEYVQGVDAFGGKTLRWEVRTHIGLELSEVRSTRTPTLDEKRTGIIEPLADVPSTEEVYVKFHVLPVWGEPGVDEYETHAVRMPAAALMASRDGDWAKYAESGAMKIPAAVLTHPHFPIKDLRKWIGAAKLDSAPETTQGWSCMNWVPTGVGAAFIVGKTVIAGTEEEENATHSGLTVRDLPNLGSWGLTDHYRSMTKAEWNVAFVADVRAALDEWFGSFENLGMAAVGLGVMVQPTYAVRGDGTVVTVTGSYGKGKSLYASYIMSGWQARPGEWTHRALPGGANDTLASTEVALAQTPIWVLDDLAPDSDANVGSARVSAVERTSRAVFNGTPRRRMGSVPVERAIAQLIVTAENASNVPSILSRVWPVDLGEGFLVADGRERMDRAIKEGLFSRLTGYCARSWVSGMFTRDTASWIERVELAKEITEQTVKRVQARARVLLDTDDIGFAGRQIEKLVALYSPLAALAREYGAQLAAAGVYAASDKHYQLLHNDLFEALVRRALNAAEAQMKLTPGRLALKAVALQLAAGKAHLTNPVRPTHPPVGTDAQRLASGWQFARDAWVPKGPSIGWVGVTTKGERLVVLQPGNAFADAAKARPELIVPGTTKEAAWASLDGETGLVPNGHAKPGRIRIDLVRSAGDADLLIDKEAKTEPEPDNRVSGLAVVWDAFMALID